VVKRVARVVVVNPKQFKVISQSVNKTDGNDAELLALYLSKGRMLLCATGNIGDFADPGKLAAYFGLVPRVPSSNETKRCGHHQARLQTGAHHLGAAKRYSAYLQQFYHRIQRRRGGGKAIIALARKFLGVIYSTGHSPTSPILSWPPKTGQNLQNE
jgi:hypothetical protein